MMTKHKNMLVVSARDDFLLPSSEVDYWLFNPEWKVLPSIAFLEGKGPVVLTCKAHDGGTKLSMLHPCRWQHNLSPHCADQIAQAVINPRVFKPMKAAAY